MDSKRVSNFLLLIAFSLGFYLLFQAFMNWYSPGIKQPPQEIKPGQSFVMEQERKDMEKPAKFDIDFVEHEDEKFNVTTVQADYGELDFSEAMGELKRLTIKRDFGGVEKALSPIESLKDANSLGLVVALDEKTPYVYKLVDSLYAEDSVKLVYKAEGAQANIIKEFLINKKYPKIDLNLEIEPLGSTVLNPRVFVPVPFVEEADKDFVLKGFSYNEKGKLEKDELSKIEYSRVFPKFLGAEDHLFVSALVSDQNNFTRRAYYTKVNQVDGRKVANFILEGFKVEKPSKWSMSFYFGSKDPFVMNKVDPKLEKTLDYGWFAPLVKGMLYLLKYLYGFVKNYGWAILILTLLIRILMIPLTLKGKQAMDKQKEYQKRMKYIEEKYKDDKEALLRERTALTKKYGPSMLGCFSQFLQIPIMIGLYRALYTSIELYQAPFILWIKDLSAPDSYYVLPVLSGLGILFQMTTDSDAKQSMMMFLFSGILVVVTARFPAGLTLYLAANVWLGVLQNYVQKRLKV